MNDMKFPRKLLRPSSVLSCAALALAVGLPGAYAQDAQNRSAPQASGESRTYRLTFTLIHSDAGKRMNVQHYSMTIVPSRDCSMAPGPCHAIMKWGSKQPVMTGGVAKEGGPGSSQFQFTYIDVGLNLDARLTERSDGLQLTIKAENSSMADSVKPQELKDPVVLQAVLESSTMIKPGVPVIIGSLDSPGTTQHVDVEVKLEPLS